MCYDTYLFLSVRTVRRGSVAVAVVKIDESYKLAELAF